MSGLSSVFIFLVQLCIENQIDALEIGLWILEVEGGYRGKAEARPLETAQQNVNSDDSDLM